MLVVKIFFFEYSRQSIVMTGLTGMLFNTAKHPIDIKLAPQYREVLLLDHLFTNTSTQFYTLTQNYVTERCVTRRRRFSSLIFQ